MISFDRFVQIAGVIDKEEAKLLIDCGVKYLGFPLRLPVHKEDLSEEYAAEIIADFPDDVHGILITYLDKASEIKELMDKLNCSIVQLHGTIEKEELLKLKTIFPNISIIKSLVVGKYSFDELKNLVESLSDLCNAFITDTFDPSTGASGATGKTHDWTISRKLVELSEKPVILAGGLNEDNVYDAILNVRPAGVDSHTGVENKDGRKDKTKVSLFLEMANKAFNSL